MLLEQSLFVKMKAAYANADAITSLLKHAFPGCTDVFAYSQGEPLSPTGYAQIMFDSADAKVWLSTQHCNMACTTMHYPVKSTLNA